MKNAKSEGPQATRLREAESAGAPVSAAGVDRVVGLDWSGRIDTAGQRRHIWAGVWTQSAQGNATVRLENGRTRDEVADWLIALSSETPRMVVGIDLCFSYPAWFVREQGCADLFSFWRLVAGGKGEEWLHRACPDRRFWGKPHKRPAAFSGEGFRTMFRHADWDNKIAQALEGGDPERAAKMKGITPKSPFQIGGSGSVGTGSLRGMPVLLRLHEAGFQVWPIEDAALEAKEPKPLLVEIYTRLMTGPVAKSNPEARKRYLADRRRNDPLFADVGPAVLRKAQGSEDALDALITAMEMVRHAGELSRLRATADPQLRLEGNTWRPGVCSQDDAPATAAVSCNKERMNAADFRRLALALPGAAAGAHMGAEDFRVGGRIFATLAHASQGYGNLMLTPAQQAAFVAEAPEVFLSVPGGWGRHGATHIRLQQADEAVLEGALRTAWNLRVEKNGKGTAKKARSRP